jgi:midasin
MPASNERPLKRRKGGGSSGASIPEHHRAEGGTAADAAPDSEPPLRQPGRRSSKAGLGAGVREGWTRFAADLAVAERTAAAAEGGFAFAFVEGALVKAVREGHWLLLDEVTCA